MLVPFVGRPFGLPDVPLIQRAIALLKPIDRNRLRGIFKRSFRPSACSCLSLVFNQCAIDFCASRMCTNSRHFRSSFTSLTCFDWITLPESGWQLMSVATLAVRFHCRSRPPRCTERCTEGSTLPTPTKRILEVIKVTQPRRYHPVFQAQFINGEQRRITHPDNLGAGGRAFKSPRPDQCKQLCFS
jgi:hypothetical protein